MRIHRSLILRVAEVGPCVAILLTLPFDTAQANVGPVHVGAEGLELRDSHAVEMVSEAVEICLSPSMARVHATFLLRNHGPADSVSVGFPVGVRSILRDDYVFNFSVRADGQPVVASKVENDTAWAYRDSLPPHSLPWRGWYAWTLYLRTETSTTVVVDYETHNQNGGASEEPYASFAYVLATGRAWHGRIGTATVHVTFEGMDIARVTSWSPNEAVVGPGQEITWFFQDFEPSFTASVFIWYEIEFPGDSMGSYRLNLPLEKLQPYIERSDVGNLAALLRSQVDSLNQADPSGIEFVQEDLQLTMQDLQEYALAKGLSMQESGDHAGALKFYTEWERALGDIRNRLRPFSYLRFRVAECQFQLGQLGAASTGFRSVIQPDSLSDERSQAAGLADGDDDEEGGYGTEEARWDLPYRSSRGLNSFCRLRLQQIGVALQASGTPR